MSATEEAVTKLQRLSDERASKVVSLINDLAELEELEDAEDLKDARAELAAMRDSSATSTPRAEFSNTVDENELPQSNPGTISWDQLKRDCGLDH